MGVDFAAYAQTAVQLVNGTLTDLDAAADVLSGDLAWMRAEATDRDLHALRRAQPRFREVFAHGTAGRDADAVALVNTLLAEYPAQPRISGHDATDWHMHVTGRGASIAAELLAGAAWGLAAWLCAHGSSRLGVCDNARCANVYLDTSSNRCRRYCSERCATRAHVAAHRARKRAAATD
ncbi:MAG TPA: CGNR zinc finger domain-containing protein [Pilimelia sp.]|nr:CGNR zinc finger domain-containing protein [Pilimelia sp.]